MKYKIGPAGVIMVAEKSDFLGASKRANYLSSKDMWNKTKPSLIRSEINFKNLDVIAKEFEKNFIKLMPNLSSFEILEMSLFGKYIDPKNVFYNRNLNNLKASWNNHMKILLDTSIPIDSPKKYGESIYFSKEFKDVIEVIKKDQNAVKDKLGSDLKKLNELAKNNSSQEKLYRILLSADMIESWLNTK